MVLEQVGGRCTRASIVLVPQLLYRGALALPRLRSSVNLINEESVRRAARAAVQGATPLSQNAYKVPIFETLVRRAILLAASNVGGGNR